MIFAPIRNGIRAPVVVARGAATSTAFVWRSDQKSKASLQSEQLQQIEERLANNATIPSKNVSLIRDYD